MLDYLFIGPLGWDKSVWNKILLNLENKAVGFIEYMNHQEQNINEAYLVNELQEKIRLLKETGTIIASSFGSRFILYCMNQLDIKDIKIILIEGFEEIPAINLLEKDLINRPETFQTADEYLDTILDDEEKKDRFIKEAVLNTIVTDGYVYKVKCTNSKMLKYLSLLSGIKNEDLLLKITDNNYNVFIFSSDKVDGIPYVSIPEGEHLLMLSNPQELIKKLV